MERNLSLLGLVSVRLVSNMLHRIVCERLYLFIIHFVQEEIFASSFAAAAYLQSIDFPKDKKVCL